MSDALPTPPEAIRHGVVRSYNDALFDIGGESEDMVNYTDEWLRVRPEMRQWLAENDPGRLYVLDALAKRIKTPKRIYRDREAMEPFEMPRQFYESRAPKPGTLEAYDDELMRYGADLKDMVEYEVARMGPCHYLDVIYDSGLYARGLCDSNGCIMASEEMDFVDALYKLLESGRIYCPDGEQMVDVPRPKMLDMEPIRMVELFAGIGAFRKALTRMGIPHTSIMSEINEFATMSYQAIHGATENLGDISKVESLPECDLLTYGFPCQDISIAGKQAGFEEGSGTRSSLLWEVRRLLDRMDVRPRVLIMENVRQLVAKKNLPGFQKWIDYLSSLGYESTWAVTDPVAHGVPQHRPRVIMVSVLGGPAFDWSQLPVRDEENHATVKDVISIIGHGLGWPPEDMNKNGIRYLTMAETWRLMGFDERDCWRASRLVSNTQIYKQAGNSIVVNVLEWIFGELIRQGIWEVRQ